MTAREAAVEILNVARVRRAFVSDVLDEFLSDPATGLVNAKPEDRRLVTNLVLGITRRRATLDALVAPFIDRPFHAVENRIFDLLHLGAYQLVFLTSIPDHAAVHETVELARFIGSPLATGFVNGVLRRVVESVTDEDTDHPTRFAVPMDDGRFRRLSKPLLPDPVREPVYYLAAAFSWPMWLAQVWWDRYGFDECCRMGFWFNAPPPLWIRVPTHVDRGNVQHRLAAINIEARPGPHSQSLHLLNGGNILDLPGFATGDFAVQDHASMLVATALAPKPGMTVLDLCAAPGGKTTHLAELMNNTGKIIACDIEAERLATVTTLAERMKISIIETVQLADGQDPPAGPFDAALVDAPCSNTGVLGRRVDVRWRLQPEEMDYLIRLQTKLLTNAIDRVKPGGAIVYSTCSIEPAENEQVVNAVIRTSKTVRKEAEHRSEPGRPSDGGYWARLRKRV
ncbi:16S rRNA (cytosine(967)-C(5))-methyltransferase RsmB [soil metagenome]